MKDLHHPTSYRPPFARAHCLAPLRPFDKATPVVVTVVEEFLQWSAGEYLGCALIKELGNIQTYSPEWDSHAWIHP